MNDQTDHRIHAEVALTEAQRNPVMSAEQSFLAAQVHALLALERRLAEVVVVLRELRVADIDTSYDEMQDQLDRAADDGWPDIAASSALAS